MKRFSLFLVSCLLMAGTQVAMADKEYTIEQQKTSVTTTTAGNNATLGDKVTAISGITSGSKYALKCTGSINKYICENGTNIITQSSTATYYTQITVSGNETDGWTFQLPSGKYIPALTTNNGTSTPSETAGTFTIEAVSDDEGKFYVTDKTNTSLGFNGNGNFVAWTAKDGDQSKYEFYPVTTEGTASTTTTTDYVTKEAGTYTYTAIHENGIYYWLCDNTAMINANSFYRIKSVSVPNGNTFMSTGDVYVGTDGNLSTSYYANTSINRYVHRTTEADDLVPQLWILTPNDGGFTFKSPNIGCYMCSDTPDIPINPSTAHTYTLTLRPDVSLNNNVTNDGKTMFLMQRGSSMINAYQGANSNALGTWNQLNDCGNYWQIQEVEAFDITLSSIGYSSVCFPFEVTLSTDDSAFEAYYATQAEGNVLTLQKIENNVIPANEGVILKGTANGTVKATFTSTGNTLSGNVLKGATAKRINFTAEDTYVLGALNNAPAFLLSTLTVVPANKAYLLSSEITNSGSESAQALSFNFADNTATAISAVRTNAGAEQYFDLNGRRVLYPTNGIYVTRSGKKLYIH